MDDSTSQTEDLRPFAVFLVGPTCCGKTEVGRHLQQLGFSWIEPSQYLKERVPMDVPILTRLKMVEAFFDREGKDYVAKRLLAHVLAEMNHAPFVITGCRQVTEVHVLRPRCRTLVIALHSEDNIRFARCTARARPDASLDFETFLRATAWEYSLGLARMMLEADSILINNGPVSELYRMSQKIVGIER